MNLATSKVLRHPIERRAQYFICDEMDTLTALEVSSSLKEIRAIGALNLAGSLPANVLARLDRIMQQAIQEARNIVATESGRN